MVWFVSPLYISLDTGVRWTDTDQRLGPGRQGPGHGHGYSAGELYRVYRVYRVYSVLCR